MRQANVQHCLGLALLRYVRDDRPTEEQFLEWLGPSLSGCYYVLKKAKLLVVLDGVVHLAPEHCSENQKAFLYGNSLFWLDTGEIIYCTSPQTPEQ